MLAYVGWLIFVIRPKSDKAAVWRTSAKIIITLPIRKWVETHGELRNANMFSFTRLVLSGL